jgi:hypothetical protein
MKAGSSVMKAGRKLTFVFETSVEDVCSGVEPSFGGISLLLLGLNLPGGTGRSFHLRSAQIQPQ